MTFLRLLVTVLSLALAGSAPALRAATIDYAREARWAAEFVPALVVGEPVALPGAPGRTFVAIFAMPAGPAKGAVVLVHGLGVHPDFGIVGELRTRLVDAGWATLSLQMPVLAADAPREDYAIAFAEAGERIAAALAWLRARGERRVAIVAHSLGAAMADAYLARPDAAAIAAWVPIGMPVAFARAPREPVLDVLAATELPAVVASAPARARALPKDCSRQITIAGADHYFEREDKALGSAVASFLERVFDARC